MHIPYCYYCYFMEAREVSGGLIRALHGRPLINLYIISYLPPGPPSFHDYYYDYYDYYHYHHYHHYHCIIYYYNHYIIHYYWSLLSFLLSSWYCYYPSHYHRMNIPIPVTDSPKASVPSVSGILAWPRRKWSAPWCERAWAMANVANVTGKTWWVHFHGFYHFLYGICMEIMGFL